MPIKSTLFTELFIRDRGRNIGSNVPQIKLFCLLSPVDVIESESGNSSPLRRKVQSAIKCNLQGIVPFKILSKKQVMWLNMKLFGEFFQFFG